VNEKLGLGRYFFIDILRDGILLFEEPGHPFVRPRPLSAGEALKETQDYYDEWFESAGNFFRLAEQARTGRMKKGGRVPPASGDRGLLSLPVPGTDAVQS
jgi:hypothetical protein